MKKRLVIILVIVSLMAMIITPASAMESDSTLVSERYSIVSNEAMQEYDRLSALADMKYEVAVNAYMTFHKAYVEENTDLKNKDYKVLEDYKDRCFENNGFSVIRLKTNNQKELEEKYGMDYHKLAKELKRDIKNTVFYVYDELNNFEEQILVQDNMMRTTMYSGRYVKTTYMGDMHTDAEAGWKYGATTADLIDLCQDVISVGTAFLPPIGAFLWAISVGWIDPNDTINGASITVESNATFTDKMISVSNTGNADDWSYAYFAVSCSVQEEWTYYTMFWNDITMTFEGADDDDHLSKTFKTTNYNSTNTLYALAVNAFIQGLVQGENTGPHKTFEGDIYFTHSNPF